MKKQDYTQWTRKQFEALPTPEGYDNKCIGECSALVVLPERSRHESGYRNMSFVTIQNGVPTYKISGCSDIIHFGGIGGTNLARGQELMGKLKASKIPRVAWEIDCLPVSGLLRIYCDRPIYVGESISSFGLYYKE